MWFFRDFIIGELISSILRWCLDKFKSLRPEYRRVKRAIFALDSDGRKVLEGLYYSIEPIDIVMAYKKATGLTALPVDLLLSRDVRFKKLEAMRLVQGNANSCFLTDIARKVLKGDGKTITQ